MTLRRIFTVGSALTLFGSAFLINVTAAPAFAVECSGTETIWTGDGSDGSVVGVDYFVVSFSTAGACTWAVPTDVSELYVLAVGAGGGGAGGSGSYNAGTFTSGSGAPGGGGGAGEIVIDSGTVSAGDTINITVGAGGALGGGAVAGSPGGCGADGGDSVVTEIAVTASGGKGGIGGGSNATCDGENRDGNSYFVPGAGGDSGESFTGGAGGTRQGGQGASSTANGTASTTVVTGESITFAGITGSYADGGGGGAAAAYGARSATYPGSGGGGGREPLYTSLTYNYGYSGSAGTNGLVIIRYALDSELPDDGDSGGGTDGGSGNGGGSGSDTDALAQTGFESHVALAFGVALLVAGGVAFASRRRAR